MTRGFSVTAVLLALVLTAGACDGPNSSGPAPTASPPVRWIPRAFLARAEKDGWVERIPSGEAGESFLLTVVPEIRTPAEGPWRLTITREGSPATIRIPGLTLDRGTGRLSFLMRTDALPPGEYRLVLHLEEGGMATGPAEQSFLFAID